MYLTPGSATCEYRWRNADHRAMACPSKETTTPATLGRYLVQGLRSDVDKARALFRWVAENIAYDTERSEQKEPTVSIAPDGLVQPLGDQMPQVVLQRRKAVCAGYAALIKAMADCARIPCKLVGGYSKDKIPAVAELKPEHAWNMLLVDGTWVPIDVTWAAGGETKEGWVKNFDPFWWLCPPERFIRTHLPQHKGDPTQWAGVTELPSYHDFCEGLGLRSEFFGSNLILLDHHKGRIGAAWGSTVVINLKEGWKQSPAQSRENCQVLVSAQVCRIDNNSNNLVPVDNVQVSCTYHDRARQHEVKLRILDGNEKQSYSLQILGTTHIDSNTQMKNCLLEYNLDIA